MSKRVYHPADSGPLHPGANLGDGLSDEEQRIIPVAKGGEGVQILFLFLIGESSTEPDADDGDAQEEENERRDVVGGYIGCPEEQVSHDQVDKRPYYIKRGRGEAFASGFGKGRWKAIA